MAAERRGAGGAGTIGRRAVAAVVEVADLLAHKLGTATEPRARHLRRRRRALRWGVISAATCLFWALVTAVIASWATPVWVLIITSAIAAGAAVPATLLLLRYRWLRSLPLPAARPTAARRLPPPGSAARPAMAALGASERGLFSLLGVLERGQLLPDSEIRQLKDAANATATTMAATASEVVSMEKAMKDSPHSRDYLTPTINAFTAQLGGGVRQYNEMVTAAAQLVSTGDSPMNRQHYQAELTGATDRLRSWAYAFDELAALHRG
ncbi:hypothetical protein H7J07_00975 [Mycobacterium koreense]|uniref:Uncharacterized protein n=1 Tax=Mycolicibacillus koreensis TaxID=1069220 RepID=A0A7I7SBP4_9MYCO|nr:hypothetical protein [Mycolicibacillus koreensis]MCV7246832.1 hypothetical protein [Mycolicibacillus koreensis]ODR07571.1 hypothetical protein BHQ15_10720 [Mycolicibacillus koreensis]OSC35380.1 hypothetical protein B8W67_03015 [Mycolicibacillus koreensis]BBY54302.1 hypothetical protein MKOR_15530 [Mycolicibacillus koreensis]